MHSPLSILHEKLCTRSFALVGRFLSTVLSLLSTATRRMQAMHVFDEEENTVIFFRWLNWFGQNLKSRFHKQILLVFLCRMDKILQIHYEHERSIELLNKAIPSLQPFSG